MEGQGEAKYAGTNVLEQLCNEFLRWEFSSGNILVSYGYPGYVEFSVLPIIGVGVEGGHMERRLAYGQLTSLPHLLPPPLLCLGLEYLPYFPFLHGSFKNSKIPAE